MSFDSKLSEKGQAFSTFKLLIAAIVAIAILGILFGILGALPALGGEDPTSTATSLVRNLKNSPGSHTKSKPVIFQPGDSLTSRSIALGARVGLDSAQVCVSQGEFFERDIGNFIAAETGGTTMTNEGSTATEARLSVICDRDEDIQEVIEEDFEPAGLDPDWVDDCRCVQDPTNRTCCVIMLRTTG